MKEIIKYIENNIKELQSILSSFSCKYYYDRDIESFVVRVLSEELKSNVKFIKYVDNNYFNFIESFPMESIVFVFDDTLCEGNVEFLGEVLDTTLDELIGGEMIQDICTDIKPITKNSYSNLLNTKKMYANNKSSEITFCNSDINDNEFANAA